MLLHLDACALPLSNAYWCSDYFKVHPENTSSVCPWPQSPAHPRGKAFILKMVSKVENGGRVLLLGLFIFFLVQVFFSANKLRDKKTAVSTTRQYDQSRLMPSISFCFYYKKKQFQTDSARAVAEETLKDAR